MKPTLAGAKIAATAARWVVEEGMEYGAAKRAAARQCYGRQIRAQELPSNEAVESEVRSYLAIFHAETQPRELSALRTVAATWMQRLAEFRPYLTGAVWRGTATRLSNVHLQLFCDDSKSAELALIDRGVLYEVGSISGPHDQPVDVLIISTPCPAWSEPVTVCLSLLDHYDLRGALKLDAKGRLQRGDLAALQTLMKTA